SLVRLVGSAQGTGPPRPASEAEAVLAVWPCQMGGADRHVVVSGREGPDRAGGEAGPIRAGLAWARPVVPRRQRYLLRKGEGSAIGMPQAVVRMNQHADRGGMDRFGAPRPSLEREIGRAVEGEEGRDAQRGGRRGQLAL